MKQSFRFEKVFCFAQIVVNCLFVPLYFVKFFGYTAVLPDAEGNLHETAHYFHAWENLSDSGALWILYVSLFLSALSLILAAARLFCRGKAVKIAGVAAFCASAAAFLFAMFSAAGVGRGF